MSTRTLKLNPKAEIPLAIIAAVLGITELLMSILINFASVYGIIGLLFFLPAIVVGVLVITQEENRNCFILGVIGLGCTQAASTLVGAWIPVQIMKMAVEFILSVL